MVSKFPGGLDNFTEPADPATTSLSSGGGSEPRTHTQHHTDLGDAIEAMQAYAVNPEHDHSGGGSGILSHGSKLKQINTHEDPDTDKDDAATGIPAIHHTLGTGHNQAARGDHTHHYNSSDITGQPSAICDSKHYPEFPSVGMMVYETDTHRVRVWDSFRGEPLHWQLLPVANIPSLQLRQAKRQKVFLYPQLAMVEWTEVAAGTEDDFGYWVSGRPWEIKISEAGLYKITSATQWDPSWMPDVVNIVLCKNGEHTEIRTQQFVRGNTYVPGFSQTIEVSGQIRFKAGDTLSVGVNHNTNSHTLAEKIYLFFDPVSRIKSRLDLLFVRP